MRDIAGSDESRKKLDQRALAVGARPEEHEGRLQAVVGDHEVASHLADQRASALPDGLSEESVDQRTLGIRLIRGTESQRRAKGRIWRTELRARSADVEQPVGDREPVAGRSLPHRW